MIGRHRDQTRAQPGLQTLRQEDAETEALNPWKTGLAASDPSGRQEPPRWLVPLLRRRPAWERGDVIVEVDKKPIKSVAEFRESVAKRAKDKRMLFRIRRQEASLFLTVTV